MSQEKKIYTTLPHHPHSWRRALWPAYVQLLKSTDLPILVGPWHGEVGFEVMYWIPLLERLKREGIKSERLIPITRGGAAAWYGTPTGLELYAMRTPQQVRVENRLMQMQTGIHKQTTVTKWDRAVLRDAVDTLKLGRAYHVLHPAWMYQRLAPFWTGRTGINWLMGEVDCPWMPKPDLPQTLQLPEVFVAAKFYHRETWSMQDRQVKQATEAILMTLANGSPVVVLGSDFMADDHLDFDLPKHPNLLKLTDLVTMTPETNLATQAAVIGRAQGFVGTYGGVAQLALRLGKPSISFFAQWQGTAVTHLAYSEFLGLNNNLLFQTVQASKIPLLLSVLPQAAIQMPAPQLDTSSKKDLTLEKIGVS